MTDVLIGAWHGGLGDSLQFSTLPEQFYKQQGRETYVADGSTFRNEEIYELVWGCNPYIKGIKEGKRNAGDIPEIDFVNPNGYNSCITNWEELHGLKPTNKYPKIYYQPKKIDGFEEVMMVDLSSVSLKHGSNNNTYPPPYDPAVVKELYENIKKEHPGKIFAQVNFTNTISEETGDNRTGGKLNIIDVEIGTSVLVNNIFTYCDLMNSCYGIIGLFSGQSALSSAIMEYNPNLKSYCIVSSAVYEKHKQQSGFIFDNIEYLVIKEDQAIQQTSVH